MRVLLIAAAVAVAACTPRDDRDPDLRLRHSPEAAVHGEPTVTGGAYDSIIYRVEREAGARGAETHTPETVGEAPAGQPADTAAADPAAADTADVPARRTIREMRPGADAELER